MTRLVALAGPSCSGKSSLARLVAEALGQAPILSTDAYYRDLSHLSPEQRTKRNFDHPDAVDHDLLAAQLTLLRAGQPILVPRYDFENHVRQSGADLLEPGPWVVVEGLFLLHWPEVREQLSYRFYLDASEQLCLERRLERDQKQRGRSRESILEQYQNTVLPMRRSYLQADARFAQLSLDGALSLDALLEQVLTVLPGNDPDKAAKGNP